MADVVIVVGTKRGKENVSPIEIKQMVGRAGRKHGGEAALAHVLVETDRLVEIKDGLESGSSMSVHSTFGSADSLIFHLMPEIAADRVTNMKTAGQWHSRSLAAFQGRSVDFQRVFAKMIEMGAVYPIVADAIRPTKIGKIAADLYFHPGDVQAWNDNFAKVFELGLENDNAAIAWALGTRVYTKCYGDFAEHRFVISECRSAMPMGLDMEPGTVTQVVLWWCSMGGPPTGRMRNQMLELREDIGRIKRALVRIDKEVRGWNRISFFDDVEMMVRKGIGYSLLDLCKLPGITKGRADYLYNAGARNAEDVAEIFPNIEDEVDEPFRETLQGIIRELRK